MRRGVEAARPTARRCRTFGTKPYPTREQWGGTVPDGELRPPMGVRIHDAAHQRACRADVGERYSDDQASSFVFVRRMTSFVKSVVLA
jgi:hypothetical protein